MDRIGAWDLHFLRRRYPYTVCLGERCSRKYFCGNQQFCIHCFARFISHFFRIPVWRTCRCNRGWLARLKRRNPAEWRTSGWRRERRRSATNGQWPHQSGKQFWCQRSGRADFKCLDSTTVNLNWLSGHHHAWRTEYWHLCPVYPSGKSKHFL